MIFLAYGKIADLLILLLGDLLANKYTLDKTIVVF